MFSSAQFMVMVFLDDVCPLLITTEPFAKESDCSSIFMTALLALFFSGGALTLIFNASSNQPAMQSFDDEGMTLTLILIGEYHTVLSTRRQFSSLSSTSCLAHRENSFFVVTPDVRLLAPATTL